MRRLGDRLAYLLHSDVGLSAKLILKDNSNRDRVNIFDRMPGNWEQSDSNRNATSCLGRRFSAGGDTEYNRGPKRASEYPLIVPTPASQGVN
jgi:hypothetical protein